MMVSTKGRYALRVMLDLAMQKQEEYVSLNDIAQRQKISMKYLESIVGMLNKAGLLQSRRGKTEATGWHADRRNTRSARF